MGIPGGEGAVLRGNDFFNLNVENSEGEGLGAVEDFVVDLETGQIEYAVLSFGGFLGIGDSQYAIPLSAFTYDPGNLEELDAALDATAEAAASQPLTSTAVDPAAAPADPAAVDPLAQRQPPRLILDITEEELQEAPTTEDVEVGDEGWDSAIQSFWENR